jgi:LmbE family N-acetylglucosaminyl deacetylase
MKQMSRLLVLAPHTDDAELGCGGSIAHLLSIGFQVHVAVFSTCEESLPVGAHPAQLRDEFLEAMSTFKISKTDLSVYDYRVRRLTSHRQEVLDDIVKLREQVNPDIVFLPASSDLHQDHEVIHNEGVRVFKDRTLWGYELPWNNIHFSAQAFIALSRADIEIKLKALEAYKSQLGLNRVYFSKEFIEGLARVRGAQIKSSYAEAFEVIRFRW